jgi:dipeptidyl aminopeptidase/acylaminoacyl peptidase
MPRFSALGILPIVFSLSSSLGDARPTGTHSSNDGPLPIDLLMSITSVVGGETPVWSPDGSRILFASGLGGFMTVGPQGGFPERLPIDPGIAGHFLASQLPAYSPDGRWVSYISSKGSAQEIFLWSPVDGREVQLTNLGARINSYAWSPDGRSVALAGDRFGQYDIWTIEVPSGQARRLTTHRRYEVFPSWTPDGATILFQRLDDRWVDRDVIAIPANGGAERLVFTDEDAFDYRAGGTFGYPMVSPNGRDVLFRSHRSGWLNYWIFPLDGSAEPIPVAAEDADQSNASWSPDGSWVTFTSNVNGTHSLKIARPGGAVRALVSPDVGVVGNPQWAPDGRSISYTFGTPTRPADLFVVEVTGGTSRALTHSMPAGNLEAQLVVPQKIVYPSTDGYDIPAYLYTPPGTRPGANLPALLWIHGGPTSQFNDTFSQDVQFFVQRGYVVLMPNIRGSSGYGRDFEDANNECWGHCDLEDVLAGVDYLNTLGIVDPERMGITGTSYGGCMSMAAPAFAPGVFKVSIPIAGYADWFHFMEEQELRHVKLLEYEFGPVAGNEEIYRRNSPIFHVDQIQTPFMIIQGAGFFPESEASTLFARALEANYKVFEHRIYPNENYYVRSRANRRQMMLDMLDFLDRYLNSPSIASFGATSAEEDQS